MNLFKSKRTTLIIISIISIIIIIYASIYGKEGFQSDSDIGYANGACSTDGSPCFVENNGVDCPTEGDTCNPFYPITNSPEANTDLGSPNGEYAQDPGGLLPGAPSPGVGSPSSGFLFQGSPSSDYYAPEDANTGDNLPVDGDPGAAGAGPGPTPNPDEVREIYSYRARNSLEQLSNIFGKSGTSGIQISNCRGDVVWQDKIPLSTDTNISFYKFNLSNNLSIGLVEGGNFRNALSKYRDIFKEFGVNVVSFIMDNDEEFPSKVCETNINQTSLSDSTLLEKMRKIFDYGNSLLGS